MWEGLAKFFIGLTMNSSAQRSPKNDISSETSDEIDLSEILRTLWRGKLIILAAAVIAMLLGGYYAFRVAVPEYKANAKVALENRQEQVVDLASVMTGISGDQASINTEVEILKSRGLIEKLVLELDLVSDPEFNTDLRAPSKTFSLSRLIGILTGADRTQDKNAADPRATLDKVINRVILATSISNVRQSYVFEIQATTGSPTKSALIANTLAQLYIRDQVDVKFLATEQATQWLTERVGQLQTELENSEAKLKEFSTNTNLVSPETLVALNRQLKDLRERAASTQTGVGSLETKLVAYEAAQKIGTADALADAVGGPIAARLLNEHNAGSVSALNSLSLLLTQAIEKTISEIARAQDQNAALTQSVVDLEQQIETQSNELVQLQQLSREAEASRLIYEYFLSRLKETSVQQGIQQPDSRILSNAVVPVSPSAPRKSLILLLSIILGGVVGVAIVLMREMAQNTFRIGVVLEQKTGYPVLGQIPSIPAKKRESVLQYLTDKPTSAAAEAIRNLRTSILLSDLDNPPQIIMSTSSIPGEGKTTQSISLAQNLGGLGKKVLLVEGDIRRRVFSEYFDIKGKKGLISVLSGESKLEDVVVRDERLMADILIGDKSTVNAADVFSSDTFSRFLTNLRDRYDYVIIDTPPVLVVPDARVIGQFVDAVVYTVKWDSTTQRQVSDGLRAFESVNVRVAGLVLSQIDGRSMRRYGYGDSYGAYAAYGGYYDN